MKTKFLAMTIVGLLMLSSAPLLATAIAAFPPGWPSLPPGTVQLSAVHAVITDPATAHGYFISTLSSVPGGFSVTNGEYVGWCIDQSTGMATGANPVILYSSLSPPAAFGAINWVKVNYILNHKQGTVDDVQIAIWHETSSIPYNVLGGFAKDMVDAADANPSWDPTTGTILAVICAAQPRDPKASQDSIIEITPPPQELAPGFTPGFWKHNIEVRLSHPTFNLGLTKASYNAFSGGPMDGVKLTDALMDGYMVDIGYAPTAANYLLLLGYLKLNGWDPLRTSTANDFNEAAGYGPYV
jgi:hypothetical protein